MEWGSQAHTLPTAAATFALAHVTTIFVAFTVTVQPVAAVVALKICEFT
jgi:hypothetical protein